MSVLNIFYSFKKSFNYFTIKVSSRQICNDKKINGDDDKYIDRYIGKYIDAWIDR